MESAFWDEIVSFRHELHTHPELSGKEQKTKERIAAFLSSHTSFVLENHGGWLSAHLCPQGAEGAAPIAFRADMDALPIDETIALPYGSVVSGVAHKCGHDGHMAALVAAACLMDRDSRIRRPVYLVFQPAEETGEGGHACAEWLSDKGVQEVYAFHNLSGHREGAVMVREGMTQPASCGVTFAFEGKGAHAGTPELGRNPASALVRLEMAAEQLDGTKAGKLCFATTVGVTLGNHDFGISPGEGRISFTLRAGADEDLAQMEETLKQEARSLAQRLGLSVSYELHDPFPATVNDAACAERVRACARELGFQQEELEEPWRPSEDFGWYTRLMPGALFYVGNGEAWPAPHDPAYDFNDKILPVAAKMFAKLAEGAAL
ncbi:MAG: M20 family metallopeptidase [Atopobiaceae bacterium]